MRDSTYLSKSRFHNYLQGARVLRQTVDDVTITMHDDKQGRWREVALIL